MICLKIRTFVVSATTANRCTYILSCCDLLENSYLCGISNNNLSHFIDIIGVVICLKIRTFVVSATTTFKYANYFFPLWFAWKFVPLWYQQQLTASFEFNERSCDLLENSYLCGISNNLRSYQGNYSVVVICLKIRTFVVSATTSNQQATYHRQLWFAWKFVPLWYQQQLRRIGSNNILVVICLKIRTFVVSATTPLIFTSTPI